MLPIISQLFIYPIKSCAGISVSSFQFDETGPLLDRNWMLVDAKTGRYLSQRTLPKMALITTQVSGGSISASHINNPEAFVLPTTGELIDVGIWEDDVQGLDCGDEAAAWFSSVIDCDCRLVYQGDCLRLADTKYAAEGTKVSYSDGFPLLVVAQASIDFLNEKCEANIGAENFRPNVVIENTDEFAENGWAKLSTESVAMSVVKPCQRCVIPALNPTTGEREASILPVLLKHCRRDKKIYFGQNLTFSPLDADIENQQLGLSVGQEVSIC